MSRIGKIPIIIPKEVKVVVNSGKVSLEGKNGKLDLTVPSGIIVKYEENQIIVEKDSNSKQNRANHGTIRSRLANMVIGVTIGHKKNLEINGIGFRAALNGNKLSFNLGFSHPVEFEFPKDVKVTVPNPTSIFIEGQSKVLVGQIAASIRVLKPVEPYKGKGIRYAGENVRRKQGKSVSK